MAGSVVLIGLMLGLAGSDADALVRRLGAAKFADREEASVSLEKLGADAIPALKKGKSSNDLEIQNRSRGLLERIERGALLRATRIPLDFDARPVSEVVQAIGRRSGMRVSVSPDWDARGAEKAVTLRSAEAVDFWKALDGICSAADLQIAPAPQGQPVQSEASVSLQPNFGRTKGPTSDWGPFRVKLASIHYQHDLVFDETLTPPTNPRQGKPDEPADAEQFFLRLSVASEPRLILNMTGGPRLLEAIDERGQSLLPARDPEPSTFVGLSASSWIHTQSMLQRSKTPGNRLKRLRGVIPVQVAARRADPLALDLSVAGASVKNETAALKLEALRPPSFNRQRTIEISLVLPTTTPPEDAFGQRTGIEPYRFELVDEAARPIPWYLSTSQFEGDVARLVLTTLPGESTGTPKWLRYYSTIQTNAEIPFEFRDVRIP